MSTNQPKLRTLDERRAYLFTQFDRDDTYDVSVDFFVIHESRLKSFQIRAKETYGSNLLKYSLEPLDSRSPFMYVEVTYYNKLPNEIN